MQPVPYPYRKFRVFTWDRVLIYGGLSLLTVALVAKALHYGLTHDGIRLEAGIAMGLAVVGIVGLSSYLFAIRYSFKRAISFYTFQGVGVIFWDRPPHPQPERAMVDLQRVLEDEIARWSGWKSAPGAEQKIRAYMAEGFLTFRGKPISWNGIENFALGLQSGNNMEVTWRADDSWPAALSIVRHEAGHVCLTALGVEGEEAQHRLMDAKP